MLLLAASCTVIVAEGRQLDVGMVMLKNNTVVFGGDVTRGAPGETRGDAVGLAVANACAPSFCPRARSKPFSGAGINRIENPTRLLETKEFKKITIIINNKSALQNADKGTVVMSALEESLKLALNVDLLSHCWSSAEETICNTALEAYIRCVYRMHTISDVTILAKYSTRLLELRVDELQVKARISLQGLG
jgi:hypothetical protein